MKRFFALLLALLMVLSLTACVSSNNAAQTTATETAALSPEAAAEQAAAETKDTTSLSDIIRVPFGYLLDWLYVFSSNYGVALILFSLIVKLVLLPMSIKSKKSMLKMSRLAPLARSIEAKYGDDRQKAQMAVQQMYKEEGVSMGGGCLWSFIPLLILFPLYYVIREPITYMLHNSRSVSAAIVASILARTRTMPSWPQPVILASSQRPLSPSPLWQARNCRISISHSSVWTSRPSRRSASGSAKAGARSVCS